MQRRNKPPDKEDIIENIESKDPAESSSLSLDEENHGTQDGPCQIEDTGRVLPLIECTQETCSITDMEKHVLKCNKCNRLIHYKCTGLPLYQLQHLVSAKKRNNICISCTKITDSLKDILPSHILPSPPPKSKNDSVDTSKLEAKQKQIESLVETIKMLNATITDLRDKIDKNESKSIKDAELLNKKLKDAQQRISTQKEDMDKMRDKLKSLENTESTFKSILNSKETELRETQNKLSIAEQHLSNAQNFNDNASEIENKNKEIIDLKDQKAKLKKDLNDKNLVITELEKKPKDFTNAINKRFETFEKNIKISLTTQIANSHAKLDKKLADALKNHHADITTSATEAIKRSTTPAREFKEIIKEQRNEQMAEENDKRRRASNIIVHGLNEHQDNSSDNREYDSNLIKTLFSDIGLNTDFKSIYRLGKRSGDASTQRRPLKITMINESDKDRVLASLSNLKGKDDYIGVSITEDYSLKERELIKSFSQKAKDANENEDGDSQFIWRVRGTPKNGLFLKKFKKRVTESQPVTTQRQ